MAPDERSDSFPPAVEELCQRIAELEAELARANTAMDDPLYPAGRLERLLKDKQELRDLEHYIASTLRQAS
jgi:hypothetical protein